MPDDETLAHPEQPRFLLSAWMWAVVLFVFVGAIVAITFGTMSRGSNYEDARARTRTEKLKAAQKEWDAKVNKYGWVDKEKGIAHIPVRRAMELELAALQARQPAPAGPIATPAADTPPVTATGAEPPANPPAAAPAPPQSPPATAIKGPGSEIGAQPAAAANPPAAVPGTQPGASATPAAAPQTQTVMPPAAPTGTPISTAPGTPIPVREATPTP